jgi:hypothetical protein
MTTMRIAFESVTNEPVSLNVQRELEKPEARADLVAAYARLRRLGPVIRSRSLLFFDGGRDRIHSRRFGGSTFLVAPDGLRA